MEGRSDVVGSIAVSWSAPSDSESASEQVALYPIGETSRLASIWTNGKPTGKATFSGLWPPGQYELRYVRGSTDLTKSSTVTALEDRIELHAVDASARLAWVWTNRRNSGQASFTAPREPGDFELLHVSLDSVLARSAPIVVSNDDCNQNGIRDSLEISTGLGRDCNLNLLPDDSDIAIGTSQDEDTSGTPDECEVSGSGLQVCGVGPDHGGANSLVTVEIRGSGFKPSARVALRRASEQDSPGRGIVFSTPARISATFDLRGARPGPWDLLVSQDDGEFVLEQGFTVEEAGEPSTCARSMRSMPWSTTRWNRTIRLAKCPTQRGPRSKKNGMEVQPCLGM